MSRPSEELEQLLSYSFYEIKEDARMHASPHYIVKYLQSQLRKCHER